MGDDTKHNDPARAEGKDLKVTYRVRVLDSDHPEAADLHRRQIAAVARIIRRAAVMMIEQEEAQEAGG